MKHLIGIVLLASFLFIESGCKEAIEDAIDCILESTLLKIEFDIDANNPKLVHFEFVNMDTEGSFTLNPEVKWDFGDGGTATSTNNKVDHTYSSPGDYKVTASFTLHRGSANCNSMKEKTIGID